MMAAPEIAVAPASGAMNRRILVVDDNRAIHEDFRKILAAPARDMSALTELEAVLFGQAPPRLPEEPFSIDSAYQGRDGQELVRAARAEDRPYAVAFVDVRMPPGWDGVETALQIWEADPEVQIVICTAYSDYTWEETIDRLGRENERFLILKKPFDHLEVRQLAAALSKKWTLARQARHKDALEERHHMEGHLRRAQKLEALGRLAAGIAHEINNPLAFLIANMQYVRDGLREGAEAGDGAGALEELRTALAEACVGGERIKQIVRDLRAFAQPHDERLALVDVGVVVERALRLTGGEILRRAQLVTRVEETPPVSAIAGRLEQVFVNLFINAAHAIPPGRSQENQIRVGVGAGAGGGVVVEIADSGVGIPEVNLDRIFDPFFTTKPVGAGTGLGLSICHSIVTAFGGELTVESQEGHGSVFRVSLPAAEQRQVS
jgi:signal transduction histidine kinase